MSQACGCKRLGNMKLQMQHTTTEGWRFDLTPQSYFVKLQVFIYTAGEEPAQDDSQSGASWPCPRNILA